MKQITQYNEITAQMADIRSKRAGFLTNFFIGEKRGELLINKELLYIVQYENSIFILHKDDDFYHLYFMATNIKQLHQALEQFNQEYSNLCCIVDIVGTQAVVEQLSTVFEEANFLPYQLLYRMQRVQNINEPQTLDARVLVAQSYQAKEIQNLLTSYFDAYSEQLPLIEEIEQWIAHQTVLLISEGDTIVGFVIYEINGVTSYLRYWFTHPNYRNRKIGSALLRRFFYESRHTQRQLFWVVADNENAIVRYQHYGFAQEQLYDKILINFAIK
ncbi:MAG: GNAT family N-acetyltransferase [Culturomica sp.]|jgi:GNAT superfamily N-acetyltransferase|nr:GNAT family N-acetyltransferase [Culturomica sp.]